MNQTEFDYIFIGSGIICVLEAIYLDRCGHKVLMIDDRAEIGGVWTPIELFGLSNVENAVHYFLDNPTAFPYMQHVLGWSVEPTAKKFRLFTNPVLGLKKIPYDESIGRYFAHIQEEKSILKPTLSFLKRTFQRRERISRYIRGGTNEIFQKVKSLLNDSEVLIQTNTPIDRIFLDLENKRVEVTAKDITYIAKTLYVTHGSRIGHNLFSKEGQVSIPEQRHPRPQVHFLVSDTSSDDIWEGIFVADPQIKYVHDITRFTREAQQLIGKKKLFVIALHRNSKDNPALIESVFQKLKVFGIVSPSAILEQYKWWDTFLPALNDAILEGLESRYRPMISILKTDDFTAGIAHRAKTWSTTLSDLKTND